MTTTIACPNTPAELLATSAGLWVAGIGVRKACPHREVETQRCRVPGRIWIQEESRFIATMEEARVEFTEPAVILGVRYYLQPSDNIAWGWAPLDRPQVMGDRGVVGIGFPPHQGRVLTEPMQLVRLHVC